MIERERWEKERNKFENGGKRENKMKKENDRMK